MYSQSTGFENMLGPRTQKTLSGIASLHITTGHQYASQSIFGELQTCERLEIRCECAANQETKSEDLSRRSVKIGHFTTSRALETKRVLVGGHSDE
jgi:hypothetical protein